MANYAINFNKILRCEKILGHEFVDKLNCLKAIQASGHRLAWEGNPWLLVPKNDEMAVFGDVVAKTYLCEKWLATGRPKGDWTKIQVLLTNNHLDSVGKAFGLDGCLILNGGTTTVSKGMMATAMEALFAAVYLDGGFEALAEVFENLALTHELLEVIATSWLSKYLTKGHPSSSMIWFAPHAMHTGHSWIINEACPASDLECKSGPCGSNFFLAEPRCPFVRDSKSSDALIPQEDPWLVLRTTGNGHSGNA